MPPGNSCSALEQSGIGLSSYANDDQVAEHLEATGEVGPAGNQLPEPVTQITTVTTAIDTESSSSYCTGQLSVNHHSDLPDAEVNRREIQRFEPLMQIIDKIEDGEGVPPQITMRYEMLRFCTLRSYPKENKPFITRLAAAGFYYANNGDEVVCYTCARRKSNWREDDVPMDIHRQLNPNCGFLLRNSEVNVPIRLSDRHLENSTIPAYHQTLQNGNVTPTASTPNATSSLSKGANISAMPKYPKYASKTVRVTSFNDCGDIVVQPDSLADSGFFYAGFGDCVRCFQCGVGLRHWSEEDDPWIEHSRWSKDCAFVRQVKGQEFVNLVQMAVQNSQNQSEQTPGYSTSTTDTNQEVTANGDIENLMHTDAAQSVLEMGYNPNVIRRAIREIYGGCASLSTDSLVMEIARNLSSSVEEVELDHLIRENQYRRNRNYCICCTLVPRDILFLSCRCPHLALCHNCFLHFDRCPLCNTTIKALMNVKRYNSIN